MAAHAGQRHHFAVLTEKQVIKLRRQPDNMGHYHKLLGKVTSGTISAARRGGTWTYLNRSVKPIRKR